MRRLRPLLSLPLLFARAAGQADACGPLLAGSLPALRGKDSIDLARFAGKPLMVVNTASHCGFTSQFKGLERLYQRYKEQGLELLGVPSDDFRQEAAAAAETARICYVNYGVTFSMSAPQVVTGRDAIALFRHLAAQSGPPRWNFYKYVIDRRGRVVARFSSLTKPEDPELLQAIEQAIASAP
jgi:glutathione peroxidase